MQGTLLLTFSISPTKALTEDERFYPKPRDMENLFLMNYITIKITRTQKKNRRKH